MAQFNYTGLARRVHKIMGQYGYPEQRAYLRRSGSDREIIVVEADFSPRERMAGLAEAEDVRFLMSIYGPNELPVSPDPDQEHDILVIVRDSEEYEYLFVAPPKRTAPGDVNVFWQLHVRAR